MKAGGRMTKDEWKTVVLGDVAEFVRGINFKPDDVVPTGTPGAVACMRRPNGPQFLSPGQRPGKPYAVGMRPVGPRYSP